ncbi:MarR family winged helix-turn-helix transcriptional regulator [Raoultibacter timonensis]|uniref:HTH marR-type domain-containing protein n=1 Tax=Raoultibacter timonensis TaxID=1907662 RepID=A0ABN6MJ91_9ACTN|nr:MarR family winged helix-turn-helix transcriptional regulator [Raoultibacter timonensis]BDE96598.1 hypothetical protein CE91St30_19310 [Raoultibacter timonensis]BDF51201.1 hypothetical protein CE91St31_19310 [Raoultibacter timonensis]
MVEDFIDSLERLHERVEDENRAAIGPYTGRQLMMMAALATYENPPTLGEFADRLRCSYQNVRVLVSLLEDHGCTLAQQDPNDGRRLRIVLTDEGRELTSRVKKHLDGVQARYAEAIPEEDMTAFVRVVDAILEEDGYIMTFEL